MRGCSLMPFHPPKSSLPNKRESVWARFVHEEHGAELVEFAVCATLLLSIVFGILGCSLALYSYHYCSQMAREASRYASVRGSSWNGTPCSTSTTYSCVAASTDVTRFVTSITPSGFKAANLSVTTTWPGTNGKGSACATANGVNSPGCVVGVRVGYAFSYNMPFMPRGPLSLSSTSTRTIAQ